MLLFAVTWVQRTGDHMLRNIHTTEVALVMDWWAKLAFGQGSRPPRLVGYNLPPRRWNLRYGFCAAVDNLHFQNHGGF